MWSSREFLRRCEELHALEFKTVFEAGTRVARGFSDLGFEEFIILPGEKLLSIYTGNLSPLREEERAHFFLVPEIDYMLAQIDRLEFDVDCISTADRRVWSMQLRDARAGAVQRCSASSVAALILEGLIISHGLRRTGEFRKAAHE